MMDSNGVSEPPIVVNKQHNIYQAKLIISLLLKVNLAEVSVSELHDYLGLVDELLNER